MFLRNSRLTITLCSMLAASVGAYAQEAETEMAAPELSAETVVATVNGSEIKLGAVISARRTLPDEYQQLEADVLFDGIVTRLVQQEALSQQIGDLDLALRFQIENDRRAMLAGEALMAAVEAAVTEEAIQAAYDAAFADFEPQREYRAAHILVETQEDALALIEELDGGADFADLARQKSTGPSGPNGGDLGWFGKGAMVAPFEEAVLAMEAGSISAPVQTQFGWHVIKLIETRLAEVPPLDSIRDQLAENVRQQATEATVLSIVEAADVSQAEGIDASSVFDDALLDK